MGSDAKVIVGLKRMHRETVCQVALLIPSSDAKDIAVDICLFDRLTLRNFCNPIFGMINYLMHRIRSSSAKQWSWDFS